MGAPPTIEVANLGMADSLILMVLALVVFGPRRLPQIGRQIGKLMYEFRKASNDFKYQMEEELRSAEDADRRKKEEDRLRAMALEAPKEQPPAETAVYSNPAESPAAYETSPATDPYLTADAATASADPQPPDAKPSDESTPRIQPPSSGETVAAARPGSAAAEADGPQVPAGEQPPKPTYYFSAKEETTPPGSPEVTEQATRNG